MASYCCHLLSVTRSNSPRIRVSVLFSSTNVVNVSSVRTMNAFRSHVYIMAKTDEMDCRTNQLAAAKTGPASHGLSRCGAPSSRSRNHTLLGRRHAICAKQTLPDRLREIGRAHV